MQPVDTTRTSIELGSGNYMAALPHERRASLTGSERAYAFLKRMILTGEMPPGLMVNESAIAEDLQMSRTPVREALRRLQQEHLIQNTPFVGMQVVKLSGRELSDIFTVRLCIELFSIETALSAHAVDADPLREVVARQEEALVSSRWDEAIELGWEFHIGIVSMADNGVLVNIYQNLADQLKVSALPSMKHEWAWRRAISEHSAIVEALANQDAGKCSEMTRLHLANGLNRILTV